MIASTTTSVSLVGLALMAVEIIGVLSAIRAVLTARTSQGAVAWAVALVSLPLVTAPLYWIFGRSKFRGRVNVRREGNLKVLNVAESAGDRVGQYTVSVGNTISEARVLEQLTRLPFLSHNDTTLLIDGQDTFDAIFAAIDTAEEYILTQFYIINDDELGREFQQRLIRHAQRGLRVYMQYDEIGSKRITKAYLRELEEGGVHVSAMNTTRGWLNRFQLNFRNHRKIVVIDGHTAFVGGHNVGDEYLSRHRKLTPWRDTHMKIEGPAALAVQLAFLEDWHWATRSTPQVCWDPRPSATGDTLVFVLPSGPDDEYETCGLFFTHAINSARERIWIASPYFVPDEGITAALQLAAMRGVDVRVLIPEMSDNRFVRLAAMSYVEEITAAGVKMYQYQKGFMHQKVVLIDDSLSVIGTANFDNRSFRLNFEISIVTADGGFTKEVETMLEDDLANARLLTAEEIASAGALHRVKTRFARLLSPVL